MKEQIDMKKHSILLPLLAVPFLMGNSPMPYPYGADYSDFEYAVSTISENDIDNAYRLELTNTGTYHLHNFGTIDGSKNIIYLYDQSNSPLMGGFLSPEGALFTTQTLAPGQSASYVINNGNEKVNLHDVKKVQASCFNVIDNDVTYSEPKVKCINSTNHVYQIDTKLQGVGDYYYGVAVDVKYDNKDYSFIARKDTLKFSSYEKLDLNKLSIEKMTFYRSTYNTYKGGVSETLMASVIFIFIGLTILILTSIVLLIVREIRKNRKAK